MTFTIDIDNNITVWASSQQTQEREEGTETFSSPQELATLAAQWPGSRLVEIWNGLPGVEPVQRFTSRQVAAARIWKAIPHLPPAVNRDDVLSQIERDIVHILSEHGGTITRSELKSVCPGKACIGGPSIKTWLVRRLFQDTRAACTD